MGSLARLIDVAIGIYSVGLIVYCILGWLRSPQTDKARLWLGRFYEPVLAKLRAGIKPVRLGSTLLDWTPLVLLGGLVLLKGLVLYLLPRGW